MVDLRLAFWSNSCLRTHVSYGAQHEDPIISKKIPKLTSLRKIYRSMKNTVFKLRGIRKTRLARPNDKPHAEQLGDNLITPLSARVCLDSKMTLTPGPFEPGSNFEATQPAESIDRYLIPPKDDFSLVMTAEDIEARPLAVPPTCRIPPEIYTLILKFAYPGIANPWGPPLRANQAPLAHRLVNRQFASIIEALLPALTFNSPRHITQERLAHLQRAVSRRLSARKLFNSVSIRVPELTYNDCSAEYPLRLSLDLWQARLFYATALLIPQSHSVYLDLTALGPEHVQSDPSGAFEQDLSCMRRFFWRSQNRLTCPVPYVTGIPFPFLLPPREDFFTQTALEFQSTNTDSWGVRTPKVQNNPFRFPWSQLTEISLDCPMSLDDCVTILMSCDDRLRSLTLSGVIEGHRESMLPEPTGQFKAKSCDSLQSLSISTFVDIVPFFECFTFGGLHSLSISLPKPSLLLDFPTVLDFDKFSSVAWCHITELVLLCDFTLKSALDLVNACTSLNSLEWGGEILAGDVPPVKIISNLTCLTILEHSVNYERFTNTILTSCPKITSLSSPSLRKKNISNFCGSALSHLELSLPVDVKFCCRMLSTFKSLTTAGFSIAPHESDPDQQLPSVDLGELRSLVLRAKSYKDVISLLLSLRGGALTSLYLYVGHVGPETWEQLTYFMIHAELSLQCVFLNDVAASGLISGES